MSSPAPAGYPGGALHKPVTKVQAYGNEYIKLSTASRHSQLINSSRNTSTRHTGQAEAIACAET